MLSAQNNSRDVARGIQRLIEQGHITINGKPTKAHPHAACRWWCMELPEAIPAEAKPPARRIMFTRTNPLVLKQTAGIVVASSRRQ